MNTLTELCQELRNWFLRSDADKHFGTFTISGGTFSADFLQPGQYYRIVGSVFNDGVHKYGDVTEMLDESFSGAVWAMAVPEAVLKLSRDIAAWREKYEAADSAAMSPLMSESFGGYSYQKGISANSKNASGGASWISVFASKLNAWRKI